MRAAVLCALLLVAADERPVDKLLDELAQAQSEQQAQAVGKKLDAAFVRLVPPAARLLVGRAARNLHAGDPVAAEGDLDAAIQLDPAAATFALRAEARMALNDIAGAARDIQEALAREPRFPSALQTLSQLLEKRGNWTGAADAQAKFLAFDPQAPDGVERLRNLRRRALGQAL